MSIKVLFAVCIFFALTSCVRQTAVGTHREQATDSLELNYARGFYVHYFPNFKEVGVVNPWKNGEILARYYLVHNYRQEVPSDGIKIQIPVSKVAITSATQTEFLQLLGVIDQVTGVCSPALLYNPFLRKKAESNQLVDLGDAFNMNIERTIQLNPDMVIKTGYNQSDPQSVPLNKAGIPVVYNNEWMESCLLARAEWIRFLAVFWDKESLADSLFRHIEYQYNTVKALALQVEKKPTIMSGSNFRGTWYKPGGVSFMAQLFRDAGGSYFYENDSTQGSLPLQVESVLKNFSQTDVWLNCNFKSMSELLTSDSKHSLFRPVSLNRVYHFNRRMLPSGANDFWESAVARPDLLLRDVMHILHPSLLPNHELVYAGQLH